MKNTLKLSFSLFHSADLCLTLEDCTDTGTKPENYCHWWEFPCKLFILANTYYRQGVLPKFIWNGFFSMLRGRVRVSISTWGEWWGSNTSDFILIWWKIEFRGNTVIVLVVFLVGFFGGCFWVCFCGLFFICLCLFFLLGLTEHIQEKPLKQLSCWFLWVKPQWSAPVCQKAPVGITRISLIYLTANSELWRSHWCFLCKMALANFPLQALKGWCVTWLRLLKCCIWGLFSLIPIKNNLAI